MAMEQDIEAILFWKGEPISLKKLASMLDTDTITVSEALEKLKEKLEGRGVSLMHIDDDVMLATSKACAPTIEKLLKEELSSDIGKAGLETLSIVLYRGPVSRKDIDYVRGVNSNFILRSLAIRGLVERIPHPKDERSFLYKPTFELLGHLGVRRVEELPDYAKTKSEMDTIYASQENTA